MEKATIAGGLFKLPALWGHASSGHTKTYELIIATTLTRPAGNWRSFRIADNSGVGHLVNASAFCGTIENNSEKARPHQ
jgi:hypothetical protein